MTSMRVERWTPLSIGAVAVSLALIVFLAMGPAFFSTDAIDKLTRLFIYVILAAMWNALAGYGGLISVGQQAFFGLGAYAAVRLANFGVNPYLALFLAAFLVGIAALPASMFMLRLKAGEFAIGMWVLAEIAHLLVNLDPLINGETGTSFIELNAYEMGLRDALTYWAALGAMALSLATVFLLLRSRTGAAIQAIRDDEEAAASVGVKVRATKRLIFFIAALGAATAGALWVATAITFQPKTYFSVQWTAYMIFMVLVGGIGTFEGAIIGAVLFFAIEAWFGASGVWYLIGLGATAMVFALFLPRGLWGQIEDRFGITLLPIGYRLRGIAPQSLATTDQKPPGSGKGGKMDIGFLIEGENVAAQNGKTYDRHDPVTGAVASTAAAAGPADVQNVADAAARAFKTWSETGPGERRRLLLRAADVLETKVPEFTKLMTEEIGATAPWAGFNVMFAASMLREAAALTTQIKGEIIPSDKPGIMAMAVRQPAGVVLGMAPWNAPVILGVRAIAAPLACGNTVILRSSEVCPGTHRLIGEVMNEAGFPKGVVNVLSNAPEDAPEIVAALIAHPKVRRINFTGSTSVGKIIARLAAEHLKPVLLELGGKAPFIVLDDADLDQAVDAAAFGAFMNQGQICMSTERFIVDEKVADAFVAKFAAKAQKLPAGDPRGHVVLGALVSEKSAERMDALIANAVSAGAKVVAGGKRTGAVVEATLIDHVGPGMRIYDEESFGPVKGIVRVKNEEEAIRVANDTDYGLSAAVFSQDINRAMAVAKRIETGICHINGPTVFDEAQMPFGGTKGSGYGRFGGKAVIDEFTELRWITIEGPQHYPF